MKNLLKMIFLVPRLILRLAWNIIFGLIKTAIVLAVIIFAFLYFTNNSSNQLTNALSEQVNKLTSLFDGSSQSLVDQVSQLSTDNYSHHGSRWSSNQASVYIDTDNTTLTQAYQTAIANWNATGSFTFTLTQDKSKADIIATEYSDANSQAAGLAETETNALTNRISHVDVKLNTYYLLNSQYGYTMDRIVHTAEHELGHAIGLDHDDSETSVMESAGSYHGIQEADIAKVKELYSK